MNTDAKIEKIKVDTNFNQGINNSSFSSASNSIQNINNVETIDFNNFGSINTNSIDIPHSKTKSALEKTGATGVSVITSLGEGLGLFGEAIVDAGAIISTAQSSVTTGIIDGGQALFDVGKGTIKAIKNNDNVFDSIKNEFDNYQSLTVNNWENTKSFVSNEYVKTAFDGFYENNSAGKWISDTSYGFDNVRNVGSGVGYVGGIVAISVATFGIGGAAIGGSAAATTATTSGLSATMAGVAATAGLGKGSQNAWNDGASLGKGLAYGTASAVWEGAQFYAGGQINALNVGSNALANAGVRVGLDTLTGASEGFAQPALQKIYKDESYSELFNQAGGWKNVGIQAGMAAGMSTLGEASGLAKKIREINSKIDVDNNIEVIKQLDEIFDNKDFASSIDTLIDRNNDINGRKNASLVLSLLDYDKTPTLVSSEVFDEMTTQSQYGKLYRGITGDNVDLYINELKEGKMYVGGNNAAAYGSGIYTAYGDSFGKIVENYASSGNTSNGKIVEMLLSDETRIVDFDIINIEKEEVLDSISKRFNKYNKEIVDFNSLTLNIDSITDETDKKIALYLQKTLNDTGLYASLRGYDAINIQDKKYIVILNRGKVFMEK